MGGGIKLFRLFGIQVSLHWTWLLLAAFEVSRRQGYSSKVWNLVELLTVFAIVLAHEFGHALACRSVGGKADRIMLWPLGGVAFVEPPPRPGAYLWSIAAGPLVNVLLVPLTIALMVLAGAWFPPRGSPDWVHYVWALFLVNTVLLIFNLLPIYPLDGGQILRSLLWFIVGPARSLMAASIIGLVGAGVIVVLALLAQNTWLVIIAAFGALQSWGGFQASRQMQQQISQQVYDGLRCPNCGAPPPVGPYWGCACGAQFDAVASGETCPKCGRFYGVTICMRCHAATPGAMWRPPLVAAPTAGEPPRGS